MTQEETKEMIKKSIADVINSWKKTNEPILDDKNVCFEKNDYYSGTPSQFGVVKINVTMIDNFTHIDGIPKKKTYEDIFIAHCQGASSANPQKNEEVVAFDSFLQKFTKRVVDDRRRELSALKAKGHKLSFGNCS